MKLFACELAILVRMSELTFVKLNPELVVEDVVASSLANATGVRVLKAKVKAISLDKALFLYIFN